MLGRPLFGHGLGPALIAVGGIALPGTETGEGITNLEKLSLPADTSVGTIENITDAFLVTGFGDERNGIYIYDPDLLGGGYRSRIIPTNYFQLSAVMFGSWQHHSAEHDTLTANYTGIVAGPWSADWNVKGGIVMEFEHPAVEQLVTPSMDMAGVTVLGSLVDGTYVQTDLSNGKPFYVLLGDADVFHYIWWTGDAWAIADDTSAGNIYLSEEDVATPDLVTTWTAATEGGSPDITVASFTAGELAAGLSFVSTPPDPSVDGAYVNSGNASGRTSYKRVSDGLGLTADLSGNWNALTGGASAAPFPWQADWSGNPSNPAVTRNDVAVELNWQEA